MRVFSFVPYYIAWHYTRAYRDGFGLYKLLLRFLYQMFSIELLSKTLFAPWQRLAERYNRTLNFSDILSTFIVNSLMRIVGFFIRLIVIIIGSISIFVAALLGIGIACLWLILPWLLVFVVVTSLVGIVQNI